MRNRQPGKALEYYLRLRKPHVFDLIRDHNLFVVVRDQVLLLVDFDQELEKQKKQDAATAAPAEKPKPENGSAIPSAVDKGKAKKGERSQAIALLVDHSTAIPVSGRPSDIVLLGRPTLTSHIIRFPGLCSSCKFGRTTSIYI